MLCFVINDIAVCGCVYFTAPSEHTFIYGIIMAYDLRSFRKIVIFVVFARQDFFV